MMICEKLFFLCSSHIHCSCDLRDVFDLGIVCLGFALTVNDLYVDFSLIPFIL